MTRTHRERLLKAGFIKEVMKGGYIPSRPDEPAGESTSWYASFWAFTIAGRLAGAFRNIGRDRIARDITGAMQAAGYTVTESDPFEGQSLVAFGPRETSPYVNRMRMDWARMREDVQAIFPDAPGRPSNTGAYLKHVEEIYVNDAYNSLSIEGYKVSTALIEKVRSGNWNPDTDKGDQDQRSALAARGYWQAFQAVKQSIEKVLRGEIAMGKLFRSLPKIAAMTCATRPAPVYGGNQHGRGRGSLRTCAS